jgi:hypothetical protein
MLNKLETGEDFSRAEEERLRQFHDRRDADKFMFVQRQEREKAEKDEKEMDRQYVKSVLLKEKQMADHEVRHTRSECRFELTLFECSFELTLFECSFELARFECSLGLRASSCSSANC